MVFVNTFGVKVSNTGKSYGFFRQAIDLDKNCIARYLVLLPRGSDACEVSCLEYNDKCYLFSIDVANTVVKNVGGIDVKNVNIHPVRKHSLSDYDIASIREATTMKEVVYNCDKLEQYENVILPLFREGLRCLYLSYGKEMFWGYGYPVYLVFDSTNDDLDKEVRQYCNNYQRQGTIEEVADFFDNAYKNQTVLTIEEIIAQILSLSFVEYIESYDSKYAYPSFSINITNYSPCFSFDKWRFENLRGYDSFCEVTRIAFSKKYSGDNNDFTFFLVAFALELQKSSQIKELWLKQLSHEKQVKSLQSLISNPNPS